MDTGTKVDVHRAKWAWISWLVGCSASSCKSGYERTSSAGHCFVDIGLEMGVVWSVGFVGFVARNVDLEA